MVGVSCGSEKTSDGACMEDEMSVGCESPPCQPCALPRSVPKPLWVPGPFLDRAPPPADSLALAKADVLTFVLAPWLTGWQALVQTERYFVSVCKTDRQEPQCVWDLMLQLTPHKAGEGWRSRHLGQALSVVV